MHTNMPLGVIKHTLENTLENNYGDKGNGNFGNSFPMSQFLVDIFKL